jgi:multiple sugar transport system ATP-binding protein
MTVFYEKADPIQDARSTSARPLSTLPAVASLELKGIHKVFQKSQADAVCAVDSVSCSIADGEMVTIVGPSGSGKTTLLRLISGLEEPSAGSILLGGTDITRQPAHERSIAFVPQEPSLLPHLSVLDNISIGLRLRRVEPLEARQRVDKAVDLLGLRRLLARNPHELSGGEQRRVSLARGLVRQPEVLLLDEPLSNLDGPLRTQLRIELARIHHEFNATILYVTHDQGEALSLGQRVLILRDGAIQQFANAATLLYSPANAFVAGFIGSPPMNLLRGRVIQNQDTFVFRENNAAGILSGTHLELALDAERGRRLAGFADGNVILGVRPEHVQVSDEAGAYQALVEIAEPLGRETLLHLSTGAQRFVACAESGLIRQAGERVSVCFSLERALFFHPVSEKPVV